jgi:hypothetical protein
LDFRQKNQDGGDIRMGRKSFFFTSKIQSKMCSTLQTQQLSALLEMHAFTGSDTSGKFAGRTKEWAFKAFCEANTKILQCLEMLGDDDFDTEDAYSGLG